MKFPARPIGGKVLRMAGSDCFEIGLSARMCVYL